LRRGANITEVMPAHVAQKIVQNIERAIITGNLASRMLIPKNDGWHLVEHRYAKLHDDQVILAARMLKKVSFESEPDEYHHPVLYA